MVEEIKSTSVVRLKRFVLRLNQLINSELYPTEPTVTIPKLYKEFRVELGHTKVLIELLQYIRNIFNVKEK